MYHKIIISLMLLLLSGKTYSQAEITEKGYFYSPIGFVCKNGNIYTADMKTVVRFGFLGENNSSTVWDENYGNVMTIPNGAEIIPSNILCHPTPHHYINNTHDVIYSVIIPSSVKYIAVDAFIYPFVRFFSSDNQSTSIRENVDEAVNAKEVARYNLKGIKISTPESGINIVQMSDRTAHKELVK